MWKLRKRGLLPKLYPIIKFSLSSLYNPLSLLQIMLLLRLSLRLILSKMVKVHLLILLSEIKIIELAIIRKLPPLNYLISLNWNRSPFKIPQRLLQVFMWLVKIFLQKILKILLQATMLQKSIKLFQKLFWLEMNLLIYQINPLIHLFLIKIFPGTLSLILK